jgi:integrase
MASSRHPGVKFVRYDGGRVVVRWRDPLSGKSVQRDCEPLGLTNADARRRWAMEKAAELRKLRASLALGPGTAERVTIQASQAEYLATFANPRTVVTKRPPLASILERLAAAGVRMMQDIQPRHLAGWAGHVKRPASHHSAGTRNLHLLVAGAWLRWARGLGQLPRCTPEDISTTLRRPRAPSEPIEVLRPTQVRDLLRAAVAHDEHEPTKVAPLLLVLVGTGMRYTEGAELVWSEFDAEAKAIRLPAGRVKTKAARAVSLDVSPVVYDLLGALRLRGAGAGRVFRITRREAETARERMTKKYGAPAGWTWHMLRRTCGSVLVCGGLLGPGSAFLAAKRLGHGLTIAERHYLGALNDLVPGASTIEGALGLESEAKAIVRAVAGVRTETLRVAW